MSNPSVIDSFYNYGIHLPSKTLYMGSEYRDGEGESGTEYLMAERAIKGLHILDRIRPDDPIVILMNNPGGEDYHGYAIYDCIQACKSYVVIIVMGHAMSMGSIILQAADKRIMSPNSRLMIHYGTWGVMDHALNAERDMAEYIVLKEKMEAIYLKRIKEKKPRYTLASLKKLLTFDTYLSAKESVELGLADDIGE